MGGFSAEWERPEFDSVPSLAENAVYLLRGCDDSVLRKTLQVSYRDFCLRSAALRTWRKVELDDGITHYPVVPILSGEIDCVTQVLRLGRFPLRQGRDWGVFGDPPLLHIPLVGHVFDPSCAKGVLPGGIVASSDFIMVETVEIPHICEERAPKPFLRRYGDAIIDGALARVFSMQGRQWADMEQARQHAVAYENAVSNARERGMNGGPAANAGGKVNLDFGGMV